MAQRTGNEGESDDDAPEIFGDPADDQAAPSDNRSIDGNFYLGLIVFLDRVRGRGTIRSYSGREIHFQFPFVRVVGAPLGGRMPGLDLLRQGDTVGFDVGWTSKGLRVTVINPALRP